MTKLNDEKVPYEILIRFNADGTPRGGHVQYRRIVSLGDEVLKDEIGSAEPLDLEGFPASEIMTKTTADALAAVERMADEIKDLKAAVARVTNEVTVRDEVLTDANATVDRLRTELSAVQDEVLSYRKRQKDVDV